MPDGRPFHRKRTGNVLAAVAAIPRRARRVLLVGLLVPMVGASLFLGVVRAEAADDVLHRDTVLGPGTARSSQDSRVVLWMQTDGNLVLYGDSGSGTVALWATGTQGTGNWAAMQTDGNFVVYSQDNTPLWNSGTGSDPGAFLKVQDDGKLVIYRRDLSVAWQSTQGNQDCALVKGPVGIESTALARNGVRVHRCLVDRVRALQDAASAAGMTLGGGGYRSADSQIALRKKHCGTSYHDIYIKRSSKCSPPTARPGRSMHERGLAVDFTVDGSLITDRSNRGFRWLAAHAAEYGLRNLPSEAWHWSTNGH